MPCRPHRRYRVRWSTTVTRPPPPRLALLPRDVDEAAGPAALGSAPSRRLHALADQLGLAVGLVYDPAADMVERWLATVGLDAAGVGPTAGAALDAALADLPAHSQTP